MRRYQGNLESEALQNVNFRRVLATGNYAQLAVMSLQPNEDFGPYTRQVDQFLQFFQGTGRVLLDNRTVDVQTGFALLVPAGSKLNVINNSNAVALKYSVVYAAPLYTDGEIHQTKQDALAVE